MNNRINNHPYYSFSQNQYPNCFYPQPNPILRFQYHNSQLSYALNRNPNFPHPMMPVQNFNISRRPSIKTAESNAIIIIDEEIPEIKNIQPISSDLTTNIAIIEKKENSNNKNLKISKSYYEYLQKKVCEKCRISERDDQLLLCDYCDDAYHSYCLQTVLVDVEEMADRKDLSWACPICEKELVDINIQEKRKQEIELENLRAKNNCFLVLDKRNFMNEMIMNNNLGRNFQMRTPMFQSMQTMNIEVKFYY